MATSFEAFAREMRKHAEGGTVFKEMRAELRKPLPELRRKFKATAKAVLPSGGRLGAWVASSRLTMSVRDRGRTAGVRFTVGRMSQRNESDLNRMDGQGRTRHPLYGDRSNWYAQQVPPGVFTLPFLSMDWYGRAGRAMDRAIAKMNGG